MKILRIHREYNIRVRNMSENWKDFWQVQMYPLMKDEFNGASSSPHTLDTEESSSKEELPYDVSLPDALLKEWSLIIDQ